jgi:DNA-binding NarL/FixJ family response regulator
MRQYTHGSNRLLCFLLYHIYVYLCLRICQARCERNEGGMIRLVLVDDQPGVRQGLRMLLTVEPDMTVVGEASNGREARILVQRFTPDVVLMDVEMPEMDGIEAAAMIHASTPQSAVVMLSIHDDASTRARAYAAGAAAFVTKSGAIEVLVATIRQTAEHRKTETGSL